MDPHPSKHPIVFACVFAAYFALGKIGLAIGGFDAPAAAIWPPSGFALAAAVLFGPRIWPAVLAGAIAIYATTTGQIAASVTMAIGNAAEAMIGAVLVERLARGPHACASAKTVFRFTAIAAVVSGIGAVGGAAGMTIAKLTPFGDVAGVAMSWWLMDFSGMLVLAPFVLVWGTTRARHDGRWIEIAEALALLVFLVAVSLIVFGGRFPSDVKDYPLEFLCVPLLLWAAFRFGRRETASAIVLLAGIAVWGTLHGFGPFVRDSRNEAIVLVQAYISVTAIMGMALAAVVSEYRDAEAQLRELATTDPLTGLVNYRRLIEVTKSEIARSKRTGRPFALLLIDMNGLKRINDRYGHLVGSRAICRVADVIRHSCRAIDTPARFGGDEFAVVLPETGEEGGRIVLARVCDGLARDPDKPALSVSGGVAVCPRDGDSVTLLLRFADTQLYAAKARAAARKSAPAPAEDEWRTGTLF